MQLVQVLVKLLEVLLLAILLERAFSVLFESHYYIRRLARWRIKELIAFGVSVFVCYYWQLDLITVITATGVPSLPGIIITAAVMTGFMKGSSKLFHDVLGFGSRAYKEIHEAEPRQMVERQVAHRESSMQREDRKGEDPASHWLAKSVIEAIIKVIVPVLSALLLVWLGLKE